MSTLRSASSQKKPKPENPKRGKSKNTQKNEGKNHKHHYTAPLSPFLARLLPFCSAICITRYAFRFVSRLVSRTFISLVMHFHSYLHASIAKPASFLDICLGFSHFSPCFCCSFYIFPLLSFLCESQLFFSGFFWDWLWIRVRVLRVWSRIGFDSPRFALVMWFQLIHGRG